MATTLTALVASARIHLIEATASFWTDAELIDLANRGIHDLWAAINDTYQDHFLTIDETNVSQAASATSLTGVPADVFRIHAIEPRDLSAFPNVIYTPKDFTHADFLRARAASAGDASTTEIFYDIIAAGAPVAAPTIRVAPAVTTAIPLRLIYVPTLATLTGASNNPIPGESDNAVIAWIVAFARAKEREDRAPDSEWLTIYATEKTNLLVRLTPRQVDQPDIVEAVFEPYWE